MTQPRRWVKSINLSLTLIMLCCTSQRALHNLIAARISGIVTDPSGSAISGVNVNRDQYCDGTPELYPYD